MPTSDPSVDQRLAHLENALARRTRELQALHAISLEINSQPDLPALLQTLVEAATRLLDVPSGALYLMRPDGHSLELAVSHNLMADMRGVILQLGEGLAGRAAQSGEVMMVSDYAAWEGRAPIFRQSVFKRVLAVPLRLRDTILGVIDLADDRRTDLFDADEIQLAQFFADQAAIAVQNARLMAAAQHELSERTRAERRQSMLLRIAEATHTSADLDALYRSIHHIVGEWMPADNFYIALYDPATDLIEMPYFVDEQDEREPPHHPGRGLTAYVLRTGRPLLANPEVFATMVARGEAELVGTPSVDWLGVPLRTREAIIGVLAVQTYTAGVRLTEEHLQLLIFASDQVAMTIERKRSEEALRRSEREYRELFAAAQRLTDELTLLDRVRAALTRELDERTIFRVVCEAVAETFGYTLVSLYLVENDRLILQHQVGYARQIDVIPIDKGILGRVARTGQPELLEDAHADPDYLEAEASIVSEVCVPLKVEGRVVGALNIESRPSSTLSPADLRLMIALSEHISAAISRARLYTAARESAARLQAAIESLPFDFWACDRSGRYVMQNSTSIRHWGNQLGKLPAEVTTDPGVLAHWQANNERALAGEIVRSEVEYVHEGQPRIFQEILAPIREGSQITGLLGVNVDITERKRAEEAMRSAQKLESLGVLAGGIAHDFNNLLVAMLSQSSLALAHLPPGEAARPHLEKAIRAATHAAELTRQLLAYSGGGQFHRRPLDLNALIRDNLHLLAVTMPKSVQLRTELAVGLPLIDGDTGQLQQVVMNLLINAGEAIGERAGVVTVKTAKITLGTDAVDWSRHTGEVMAPGPYVLLEVRDTGQGMSAETLSRIFDPFFTTKFTGRGLGLAAVLGIVRGHGGGLHVTSVPGAGTTFRLAFPVSSVQALPAEQPPRESSDTMSDLTVLVIDDEEPVRVAVADILESEGLTVLTAANGKDGLDVYARHRDRIGVVLLDLSMPGLSGEETFMRLREIDPDVRVLLSSGYNQTEVIRRFGDSGYAGFIQKPYDDVQLLDHLRRFMRRRPA